MFLWISAAKRVEPSKEALTEDTNRIKANKAGHATTCFIIFSPSKQNCLGSALESILWMTFAWRCAIEQLQQ